MQVLCVIHYDMSCVTIIFSLIGLLRDNFRAAIIKTGSQQGSLHKLAYINNVITLGATSGSLLTAETNVVLWPP